MATESRSFGAIAADHLQLILADEVPDLKDLTSKTLDYWKDHVNPAFLSYRKSVADDYASIEWRSGKPGGVTLVDAGGNTFIDCLGGFGIYNVGHLHPTVVGAVQKQMSKQALNSQELLDPLRAFTAHLVAESAPGDLQYVFFTNSGTESVEHSLKFAMLATGRKHFVGILGGFHGKTFGSLSATSKSCFRSAFGQNLLPFTHVPVNDCETLRQIFVASEYTGNSIAGLIIEPILGEGGIHECSNEYLQTARELCTKYGAALIFDEVQTGMGRTGTLWACEASGVAPDIMAIGKGFGGGVTPAGAVIGSEWIWKKYFENPFLFTTTFGGNPIAMAAATATFHVLSSEGLIEGAKVKGNAFMTRLRALQAKYPGIITDVRGRGLMIGIEFRDDPVGYRFARGAFGAGILISGTLVNSKVIRVEPPLTITMEEIDTVISRFDGVFATMLTEDPVLSTPCPTRVTIPGWGQVNAPTAANSSAPRPETLVGIPSLSALLPSHMTEETPGGGIGGPSPDGGMALLKSTNPPTFEVSVTPAPLFTIAAGGVGLRERSVSDESSGTDASSVSGGTNGLECGESEGVELVSSDENGENGEDSDCDPTPASRQRTVLPLPRPPLASVSQTGTPDKSSETILGVKMGGVGEDESSLPLIGNLSTTA